jgi:hypothetical protein
VRTWLLILAVAVTAAGVVLFVLARQEPAAIVVAPRDATVVAPPSPAPPPAPRFTAAPAPIDAPPGPAPELATLRSSGTSTEVWIPQAKNLLRGFDPHAEVECYVAGCAATLAFDSDDAYQHAVEVIAADQTWTGGKKWLSPVRSPGGTITAVLILYRPD